MNIKSVKLKENLKAHFFFPDFNDDIAIIKERKTCFGWVVEPPFSIPRQLLVFIIAIENLPEVSVPYKQTIVDFYENHIENKTLQVSDNMKLSRSVGAQFCDYELSYRPMYENKLGFFEEERGFKFLWCVSDEYDNLQEQKPDRDCDERENGSLTGSIIAMIEEENALDTKLDNKKSDQAVPFACFSTDTGQDARKEVQGASSVENTSIKSARTILSTVLNDYTDYQDHILSNEASQKISEKLPSNLSNQRLVHKRLSREGLLLSITLKGWEAKIQMVMKTKTTCVLHRANWDELLSCIVTKLTGWEVISLTDYLFVFPV